jgi:monofunctional biosynthetic peptidoglycan transglycosylase
VKAPGRAGRSRLRRLAGALLRLAAAGLALTLLVILALRWVPPPTSAMMLQRRVAGFFQEGAPPVCYEWRPLERISPHAALAVVAAEDQLFLEHGGFDLEAIGKALDHNRRGRGVRGASTITQQVAKNLFLWPRRSWLRKGLEAGLTVLLEALWPKRRILEVYLNIAQFGDGVYGVPAAARHLLHTRADRLTPEQAARLAAVLPNPRQFKADRPSPYLRRRTDWIQGQMRQLGGPAWLRQLDP